MMSNLNVKVILSILTLCFVGCNSTKLVSTYKNPEAGGKYDKVYVVGITGQDIPNERIELELVRRFEEQGVRAASDIFEFHPEMSKDETNKSMMAGNLKESGYDAVLAFSLVGATEEADEINIGKYDTPPSPTDYPYYNDYYDYYGFMAPLVYSKGYQSSNTVYNMEAVLFDVSDGDLIWSAMSESVEPASMEKFAEGYAKTIADRLIYEDVVSR
jgi:hypothetical protein